MSRPASVAEPRRRARLLLVDDDPLLAESLALALDEAFEVVTAGSRAEATARLRSLPEPPPLALVDLGLPPLPHAPDEGFALVAELLAMDKAMRILVLTGQDSELNMRHALALGAVDFVPKPCDTGLLRARLEHQLAIAEVERTAREQAAPATVEMVGDSAPMQALRALIGQFAAMPFPVLIAGESGTGKELVAARLHAASPWADGPLLTLNCAAFPPDLIEAQLFGHARGAFTGADRDNPGFFERASGGTLVLDEIGEMPAALQPKLLRVLEGGEYFRVGETTPRRAAARVVAASNRDLAEEVRAGRFRQDLYHRLSVLTLQVPPLRERGDDWRALLAYFQARYAGTVAPFRLAADAERLLAGYPFPGNVRELRNIVVRLGARHPGRTVDAAALAQELEPDVMTPPADTEEGFEQIAEQQLGEPGFELARWLERWERRYIAAALRRAGGNVSQAARLLGISRTTLHGRIQRLALRADRARGDG